MSTPLRNTLSRVTGWLADRRIPVPLRSPVFRAYSRLTGANLEEVRAPLASHPSLQAFFVRRLAEGARPIDPAPERIVSPVDGTVQSLDQVEDGRVLQAKGRAYELRELLAGAATDVNLDGGFAWTLYLSPRDYHRIHAPEACTLREVAWVPGTRYSVAPRSLARRPVLSINERAVLALETAHGPMVLVLVGALNVGRIRVVGVAPGEPVTPRGLAYGRGAELARFEMGSTVVLVVPPGVAEPVDGLAPGAPVRMGSAIGAYLPAAAPTR